MPSYLHPGVYVEEIPSGSKPIEAPGHPPHVLLAIRSKGRSIMDR